LIKQGWKCKDCGINAHRVCKDRIVIECRSKRNYSIPRQISNSSTGGGGSSQSILSSSIRNRSISNRSSTRGEHPKLKQKATQTEIYDDLFVSDEESISSGEDQNADNLQLCSDSIDTGNTIKNIVLLAIRALYITIFKLKLK
jgi:hypothetical protein